MCRLGTCSRGPHLLPIHRTVTGRRLLGSTSCVAQTSRAVGHGVRAWFASRISRIFRRSSAAVLSTAIGSGDFPLPVFLKVHSCFPWNDAVRLAGSTSCLPGWTLPSGFVSPPCSAEEMQLRLVFFVCDNHSLWGCSWRQHYKEITGSLLLY